MITKNYPPETKICHIVGASPDLQLPVCAQPDDLIIAADGGYQSCIQQKIKPDFLIGDFDSLNEVPDFTNTFTFPKEKDDTDMWLAIQTGIKQGYSCFFLYGGTGGRLDHTLANIQILAALSDQQMQGYLLDQEMVLTIIQNASLCLPPRNSGTLSVFSYEKEARGVSLSGLKYCIKDAILTNRHPLGISNERTGEEAFIEVKDGCLIVQWTI